MRKYLLLFCLFIYQVTNAQAPWVNAGPNQTINAGQSATLVGTSFNVPSVRWLTSGSGSFSNQFALQTIYYPSAADIAAGGVTLTLRDRFNPAIKDKMKLKIIKMECPSVDIKLASDTICGYDGGGFYEVKASASGTGYMLEWSTAGTGFFDDEYKDTTYYVFSDGDAGSGEVWLYVTVTDTVNGCPPVKDSFFLKLNDPARIETISTDEYFYCTTEPVQFSSVLSGTATTLYWTTTGSGLLTPNPSKSPVYHPTQSDLATGYVEFYPITNDPAGPCPAAVGDALSISFPIAYINVGADTTLCTDVDGDTLKLNSHPNEYIDSVRWGHNGSGFFNNPTKFFPYYVYSATDVANGQVKIYCTGYSECGPYSDTIIVTLKEQPWVEFPNPVIYACMDETTVTASVIIHGDATGGTWTSTGYGSFGNPNATTTKYKASLWDTYEGCIRLIFTTNQSSEPCPPVSGYMTVCFEDCKGDGSEGQVAKTKKWGPVELRPNPATDRLAIITGKPVNNLKIRVADATGRLFNLPLLTNNTIDISRLQPGHYYVLLTDESGQHERFHFIKQ